MYDIIIKNGAVIDGTGSALVHKDVAIQGDRIAAIGDLQHEGSRRVVDATGMYVAPGFVDIQNHSDAYWSLFDRPSLQSMSRQGITTILVGNCGVSLAPLLSSQALLSIQKWHQVKGLNSNWVSFKEYLEELSKKRYGTNVASLVGYSTLRRGLLGDDNRQLNSDEVKKISKVLRQSLQEGAFGLSTGLSYAHEAMAGETELAELARVVAEEDGLFSIHLRSEGAEILESIAEVLSLASSAAIAEQRKMPKPLNLKISHFKIRGKDNWHLLKHAFEQLENAYQKIGNIHFDAYPYDFTWQVLYSYLPRWSYEGGRVILLKNLEDPIKRKKILDYLKSKDVRYPELFIAGTSVELNAAGKTLGNIARRLESTSEEALLSLIEHGGSDVMVFEKNLNPQEVRQILDHPLSMVATDGSAFGQEAKGTDELVHPRCFGSMPEFLHMALEENLMSIEEAVHKISGIPAMKMGLKDRGILKTGNYADLAIFSADISSSSTMESPYRFPKGMEFVILNGELTVDKGQSTDSLSGVVLKKENNNRA